MGVRRREGGMWREGGGKREGGGSRERFFGHLE